MGLLFWRGVPPTFLIGGWVACRLPLDRDRRLPVCRAQPLRREQVRGGACRIARPRQVRRTAFFATFWSCYSSDCSCASPDRGRGAHKLLSGGRAFPHLPPALRLLGGGCRSHFSGGIPSDVVPILVGNSLPPSSMTEFWSIRALPHAPFACRHLRRLPSGAIQCVVATHHHEEHVGNLNWGCAPAGVPLLSVCRDRQVLQSPGRLLGASGNYRTARSRGAWFSKSWPST